MATETDTQIASAGSKRAQLNKEKREDKNKSRVPEGQMAGGGANLAFDNGVNSNKKKGDDAKDKNSGRSNKIVKDSGGMNYRQVMAQEKKKQKKKANKKKKKSATYQGSKKALAMAWRALIPSWFTSIFVINAFAFLHLVFPKFFCALGEEWESPMTAVAGGNKGSSTKASMMKSIEPWIVVLINLFVMVIIAIIIMALMIMIALTNPWILGWVVFSELWDLIKSAF
jgi:cation transport ATPase